ncbi:tRNA (guanine-N1)-methyltransferase [Candidatus Riesia sp. GBBU]|nr:tRNA (guanine-N1)-methyltransferase [Candidatus Riesia sp. GBBU]
MKIGIISFFPEIITNFVKYGIVKKLICSGHLEIYNFNIRDFSKKKNRMVDDRPYGGGPGMVVMIEPVFHAINVAKKKIGNDTIVVYLSPQGKLLNSKKIKNFIKKKRIIFLCGRYKGIDERIIDNFVDEELSIGDYVISGGELAAIILIDLISKELPYYFNNSNSREQESFFNCMLDYPNYTRPSIFNGIKVPEVLLSGNHKKILCWRKKQALKNTLIKKPNLLKTLNKK